MVQAVRIAPKCYRGATPVVGVEPAGLAVWGLKFWWT